MRHCCTHSECILCAGTGQPLPADPRDRAATVRVVRHVRRTSVIGTREWWQAWSGGRPERRRSGS